MGIVCVYIYVGRERGWRVSFLNDGSVMCNKGSRWVERERNFFFVLV